MDFCCVKEEYDHQGVTSLLGLVTRLLLRLEDQEDKWQSTSENPMWVLDGTLFQELKQPLL